MSGNAAREVSDEDWDAAAILAFMGTFPARTEFSEEQLFEGSVIFGLGQRDKVAAVLDALAELVMTRKKTACEKRACRACGKEFSVGPGTGFRTKRVFCSDKCRYEFNHRGRTKLP
jgi:hypothetical protein